MTTCTRYPCGGTRHGCPMDDCPGRRDATALQCEHLNFGCTCKVARMEDSGRFMLEVQVRCTDCDKPFQFLGLKPGLDFDGARVSIDGLELNIGICPEGARPSPLANMLRGYDVNAGQSGSNQ